MRRYLADFDAALCQILCLRSQVNALGKTDERV
jgi:hypothetical protein